MDELGVHPEPLDLNLVHWTGISRQAGADLQQAFSNLNKNEEK